ncbi:MAG: DUF885 domain-containing protein, partial [Steroidobacteraceae bacterium]
MNRLLVSLLLAASALTLQACATRSAGDAAPARSGTTESQQLAQLFDQYFERKLELNPLLATSIGDPRYNDRFVVGIAPAVIAQEEQLERDYLARIEAIDRTRLPPQDQLSYDIFRSAREREIEGFRFPDELLPLNQFYSTPNTFVQLGSGNGMQPFKTVQDYDNFLARLDGFVQWTDQAIVNMRQGIARGYTLPRVLAERTLPQLQAQVVATPEESLFWGPVRNLPAEFSAADRDRLT